jgi:hypothetical protein
MHSLEEKNELLQRLDGARERLMAAVAGLSQPQANFKPSPDVWSGPECNAESGDFPCDTCS